MGRWKIRVILRQQIMNIKNILRKRFSTWRRFQKIVVEEPSKIDTIKL